MDLDPQISPHEPSVGPPLRPPCFDRTGAPPHPPPFSLIFAGKQMNDDKTAREYNIEGGSVLHLVLALRGGQQRR